MTTARVVEPATQTIAPAAVYPGAPDPLHAGFAVTLPGGAMARCSPVRVSAGCRLRP